jgi:hypothetical protein
MEVVHPKLILAAAVGYARREVVLAVRDDSDWRRRPSSRRQFHPCQGGLEGAEKSFFLPDDRVRRGQLLFQSQAGLRLGEAENALAVQQFDEVELDFITINHKLIVRENRRIATGGSPFIR